MSATLPTAPRNQAQHGNEISRDINLENIVKGNRRSAYMTALQHTDKLIGYYTSFSNTISTGDITKPLHQDTLLLLPKL